MYNAKILVTGSRGFIGKNLVCTLKSRGYNRIYEYHRGTSRSCLDDYCRDCDFVFHLAGVNRPKDNSDFTTGNVGLTSEIIQNLQRRSDPPPILFLSSIQALLDNPYGKSKKAAEDIVFEYGQNNNAAVYVYRLPNVFGKWCRPNYNSVIATFCYNIARGLPITVNDRNHIMNLVYIDDVVNELINALQSNASISDDGFCRIPVSHTSRLGDIADMLLSFSESRKNSYIPDMADNSLSKKLYSTYLSYLPTSDFAYPLTTHTDERGSFTELIHTAERGQVSVNIIKPHIIKGNHWHHTKNEKFIVVQGTGVIRLRKIDESEIIEYRVSGEDIRVVDIPVGYTHNIENTGNTDMTVIMWCNECFDPDRPDTYPENV